MHKYHKAPSKIQLNVPISFFHNPDFGIVTQVPQRPILMN